MKSRQALDEKIVFRNLTVKEIRADLFSSFIRRQIVQRCWRMVDGSWRIVDAPFIDDWTEEQFRFGIECLQKTVRTGGLVLGAFCQGKLKGFVSVELEFIGTDSQYLDLSSIHVSADMRRKGIGALLFEKAKDWAREKGAGKLYISSHSAVESQAFYKKMGCVDAKYISAEHVDREPFDRQLEVVLTLDKASCADS